MSALMLPLIRTWLYTSTAHSHATQSKSFENHLNWTTNIISKPPPHLSIFLPSFRPPSSFSLAIFRHPLPSFQPGYIKDDESLNDILTVDVTVAHYLRLVFSFFPSFLPLIPSSFSPQISLKHMRFWCLMHTTFLELMPHKKSSDHSCVPSLPSSCFYHWLTPRLFVLFVIFQKSMNP